MDPTHTINHFYMTLIMTGVGLFSAYYALHFKRNPYLWFFVGMFFGLIGFACLYIYHRSQENAKKIEENIKIKNIEASVPSFNPKFKEWFYLDATHSQHGPISFQSLRSLWNEKKLSSESLVWCTSMDQWGTISSQNELLNILTYTK